MICGPHPRRHTVYSHKEPNKNDVRRINACHVSLQKGSFGCCAIERHVCSVYVHRYACPVCRYVYVVSIRN